MSCPKGGFPSLRHNEIWDLTANLLSKVCNNVSIEPYLQVVTDKLFLGASANQQDGARLNTATNGLWGGRFEHTYFDIRVFNPLAPSNRHSKPYISY